MKGLLHRRVLAAAALLGVAAPASVAAPGTVAEDLAAVRKNVEDENWKTAVRALERIFTDHEGSREVVDRLSEIEELLQLTMFRAQSKQPRANELFGKFAKSFSRNGRKLKLFYNTGPQEPDWVTTDDGISLLPIRFDGNIEVRFGAQSVASVYENGEISYRGVTVFLAYDHEKRTGYVMTPGFYRESGNSAYRLPASITRIDGEDRKELETEAVYRSGRFDFEFRRKGRRVDFSVRHGSSKRGGLEALDNRHRAGIVAVFAKDILELEIVGTVEEMAYEAKLSGWYDARYREWLEKEWDRDAVIPEWARAEPGAVAPDQVTEFDLPPDTRGNPNDGAQAALRAFNRGERDAFLRLTLQVREPTRGTATWLKGLAALSLGGLATAEEQFDQLLKRFEGFGPGHLHRAMVRLRRGDEAGARADMEQVGGSGHGIPDWYLMRIVLARRSGDLEAAVAIGREARDAGVTREDLDLLVAWLDRSRRGPSWRDRYEQSGPVAVVASNLSKEMCHETKQLIEATYRLCDEQFGMKRPETPPMRVHVFADRRSYLEYAVGVGRNLGWTAGAYVPALHEMVLWVPSLGREGLWRTVRHESFHAWLAGFRDDAPVWFNEGCAQWVENLGHKGNRIMRYAGIEAASVEVLRDVATHTPVRDLMTMDHETFLEKAGLHYPQSLVLVHVLRDDDSPFRERFDAYFDGVLKGQSAKEAWEAHFAAVESGIVEAYSMRLKRAYRAMDSD